MSFVAIRTSDYEPRYFIRTDKNISALCTDKCVFNSLQHQQFLNSWQNSHFQKSDFMFYKLPDNYSILGKTPLEFMIETQGYKPPEKPGLCAKQKRRFQMHHRKKRQSKISRRTYFQIWAKIGSFNIPKWKQRLESTIYSRVPLAPQAHAKIY